MPSSRERRSNRWAKPVGWDRARLALTWWYVPATAVSTFPDVVLTQQDGARLAARSPGSVTVGKGAAGLPDRRPAGRAVADHVGAGHDRRLGELPDLPSPATPRLP